MPPDAEVRSGARLIRIVEMLATERRPLTGGEIGAQLGIPATTVHRIMATLVRLRWIEKRAAGGYVLGSGFLGVGGLGIGRSPLVQLAQPVLRQVADLSGLQSHLAVLAGASVTYLARAVGSDMEAREFHLGAAQPLHCTSAGKLLLAFLPEAEREELVGGKELRCHTSLSIVDHVELKRELGRIRSQGYSVDAGEYSDFWRSTSVPVFGPGREAVAAITCGGPPEKVRTDQQDWVRHEMLVLAEELSEQLG